jgi:hypothetical protein
VLAGVQSSLFEDLSVLVWSELVRTGQRAALICVIVNLILIKDVVWVITLGRPHETLRCIQPLRLSEELNLLPEGRESLRRLLVGCRKRTVRDIFIVVLGCG